jgi:hypothetical protein
VLLKSITQDELLWGYGLQRRFALANWRWQQTKAKAFQIEQTAPAKIAISNAYTEWKSLSIHLVISQYELDTYLKYLRRCLDSVNWRIEAGPLFIERPEPNTKIRFSPPVIVIRNTQGEEDDQTLRKYVFLPDDHALAIKDAMGLIQWGSPQFCELASQRLSLIIGRGSNEIWPDQYGEIIFAHDLEVVSRQESMLYLEPLQVDRMLRSRVAIRFPLVVSSNQPKQIAVIGFSPFSKARLA